MSVGLARLQSCVERAVAPNPWKIIVEKKQYHLNSCKQTIRSYAKLDSSANLTEEITIGPGRSLILKLGPQILSGRCPCHFMLDLR